MNTKKLFLYFPSTKVDQPIINHLVKDYNLTVNIFRAKVTPEESGYLVLDVGGEEADIPQAIEYLKSLDIEVNETGKGLHWEQQKCVHCGNCPSHCPTGALQVVDRDTMRLRFDEDLCIQCLSCIDNCPFGALTSVFD